MTERVSEPTLETLSRVARTFKARLPKPVSEERLQPLQDPAHSRRYT